MIRIVAQATAKVCQIFQFDILELVFFSVEILLL